MKPLWKLTIDELWEKYSSDWRESIGMPLFRPRMNKKIIHQASDFPDDTKEVYLKIYRSIEKCTDFPFKMWAVGSRVTGEWRTPEEELSFSVGTSPKYSDYDYLTTGNLPSNIDLYSLGLNPSLIDGMKIKTELKGGRPKVEIRGET